MKKLTEKQIAYIVFFTCILVLIGMSKVFGQEMKIERTVTYDEYYKKELVRKYPSYSLYFEDKELKGEVGLSILADSIDPRNFLIRIYAFYPKGTDMRNPMIKLRFGDDSYEYIKPNKVDKETGYVEYAFPYDVYQKLCYTGVIGISFGYSKLFEVEDNKYFMAFLHRQYRE